MSNYDISQTIAPNSDQLDAVDLLGGPRTFTITKVEVSKAEQPVNLHLAEFDRPWRPGKSMRRVLVACWGPDAAQYVGRRVTLYCDPDVKFGGAAVGGTRISHLSHIDKPKQVPLLVTRGKSAIFVVKPLVEPAKPAAPTEAQIANTDDEGQLRSWWGEFPAVRAAIEARVAELKKPADEPEAGDLFEAGQ